MLIKLQKWAELSPNIINLKPKVHEFTEQRTRNMLDPLNEEDPQDYPIRLKKLHKCINEKRKRDQIIVLYRKDD